MYYISLYGKYVTLLCLKSCHWEGPVKQRENVLEWNISLLVYTCMLIMLIYWTRTKL